MHEYLGEEEIIDMREGSKPPSWTMLSGVVEIIVTTDNERPKAESCRQTFPPHPHSKRECRRTLSLGEPGSCCLREGASFHRMKEVVRTVTC